MCKIMHIWNPQTSEDGTILDPCDHICTNAFTWKQHMMWLNRWTRLQLNMFNYPNIFSVHAVLWKSLWLTSMLLHYSRWQILSIVQFLCSCLESFCSPNIDSFLFCSSAPALFVLQCRTISNVRVYFNVRVKLHQGKYVAYLLVLY